MNFTPMLIKILCDMGNWHIMCVKRRAGKTHSLVGLCLLVWFVLVLGVLDLTL